MAEVQGLVDVVASAELLKAQEGRSARLVVGGDGDPAVWVSTDEKSVVLQELESFEQPVTWLVLADSLADLLPDAAREGVAWLYFTGANGDGAELELTLTEVAELYRITYYIANDREHTNTITTNAA